MLILKPSLIGCCEYKAYSVLSYKSVSIPKYSKTLIRKKINKRITFGRNLN